jgi:hypothetical protein
MSVPNTDGMMKKIQPNNFFRSGEGKFGKIFFMPPEAIFSGDFSS